MKRVVIIGAGVMGLGCAVRIKERYPDFEITILTKYTSPNTTGDGAAGLWGPYLLGDTPSDKITEWSQATHDLFYELWRKGIAGSCLIPCVQYLDSECTPPPWKNVGYGFRELNNTEMEFLKKNYSLKNIKSAHLFITYTCEPKLLLKYLMERFEALGGTLIKQEILSLNDIVNEDYDIIINCTGLGSKYIVSDTKVYPIRGQVTRVKAPWIYQVLIDHSDHGNYIIPNTNTVVLGGTHQVNDFNTNICPEDSKFIKEGCEQIIPGLKNVSSLFEWVGLRPGRESVRLERSDIGMKVNGKEKIIVHNYGHGGSGVTMFWGCAQEVVTIITEALKEQTKSKL